MDAPLDDITQTEHTITTEDGFPLAATVFSASAQTHKVIVMASGVGVPKYAYYKFARYLASKGFRVVTFDYRGIDKSKAAKFSPARMKMKDWGTQDIEAILQFALHQQGAQKLYYIGHSGGGQLIGLAASSKQLNGMVFLSVASGYWRNWQGFWKGALFLFWYLMPLLTLGRSYFPARLLGFSSIDIPSGVTRQWAGWGRSPNYLFNHISSDEKRRYANLDIPLLSLSFEGDEKLGPRQAVDEILPYFEQAIITRRHILPKDYGKKHIGHFGFFKQEFEDSLWEEVYEWLALNEG